MDTLSRPDVIAALVALVSALTALVRAETASRAAANALRRTGGRRNVTIGPPPGTPDRRKSP